MKVVALGPVAVVSNVEFYRGDLEGGKCTEVEEELHEHVDGEMCVWL
jgi:hypothetical protein